MGGASFITVSLSDDEEASSSSSSNSNNEPSKNREKEALHNERGVG